MKGLILAGGTGSRLYPCTIAISKQLLNCAGRPLVFFSLCTLMEQGIKDICVITTGDESGRFCQLFGTGGQWGINIEYREQDEPRGIADAFRIAAPFIGKDHVTLILGDNLFIGLVNALVGTAAVFAVKVADPCRYGVVSFKDESGRIKSVSEKPRIASGPHAYAVPGIYSFAPSVVQIAQGLKPSRRGELEITDVLREYLRRGQLTAHRLPPSTLWLDCGTPTDLMEANNLVAAMEKRTGEIIGSPEITALRQGFISQEQFNELVRSMPACQYAEALSKYKL